MDQSIGISEVDGPAEYVDVMFESMIQNIVEMVRAYRSTMRTITAVQRVEEMKAICRAVRAAKFHFHRVLDRYGPDYEEGAQGFIDLAYEIADLADSTDNEDLKNSLNRHAEEIQEARAEVFDAQ